MLSSTWRRRWTREDRAESHYQYVPFNVPPGADAVRVEIDYDRSAAVLDLGVFDTRGFRGYSGGARTGFQITPRDATPGYLPGELPSGEWRLLIGLYLVPSGGVACEIAVSTDAVPSCPLEAPPPPGGRPASRDVEIPASPGHRWVTGDLHCHTVHSDGTQTIEQVANRARRRGLDFVSVTDHNTVSHHAHLPKAAETYGVKLIPGQEVTSFTGHANCFGSIDWIDFREAPDSWLAQTKSRGGLMSINHPVDLYCGWEHAMSASAPLVELWHKTWDRKSPAPIEWWRENGGVPVGGSDFHSPHDGDSLGSPTTFVEIEDEDVLGGLAAGRVALGAAPRGPVIVRQAGGIVAVDASGMTIMAPDGSPHPVREKEMWVEAPDSDGLYRLVDETGTVVSLTP